MWQTEPQSSPVHCADERVPAIVGAIVLAIVIPTWAVGVQAMWLVAVVRILVVIGAVVVGTRVSSIRDGCITDRFRSPDTLTTRNSTAGSRIESSAA